MLTTRVTADILREKYESYGKEINGTVFEFEAKLFTSISSRDERLKNEKQFFVSKAHWDNLFQACRVADMESEVRSILTVQFRNRDFRMRLSSLPGKSGLLMETEYKYRIYNYDDPLSWIRYSFSLEKSLTRNEWRTPDPKVLKKILLPDLVLEEGEVDADSLLFAEKFQLEIKDEVALYDADPIKRLAYRTSFYPKKFPWARIDMSEILNEKGEIEYDVEVEMINAKENMQYIETFHRLCKTLICSFRGSDNYYDRNVHRAICELINSHCYQKDPLQGNYVYKQIFNQVRTLKKDDLTYGGIVGGKETNYSVTYKSDGYHSALALTPYGVWLFTIPFTYNLVSKSLLFSIDDITIVDVELIPKEKRDESTHKYDYWIEIFDALYVRGREVRALTLKQRNEMLWDYLKAINVEQLFGKKMKIVQKPHHVTEGVENFFERCRAMLDYARTLKIRTDGLIFTPSTPKYEIGIEVESDNSERTLSAKSEIVKWKNPEETTIDLRLRIYEGKRRLLGVEFEIVGDKKMPLEIPFEGNAEYPFDQDTMVDWEQIEEQGVKEGTIGEYRYNFKKRMFQFVRSRDKDKQHPNTISAVAIPNWIELQRPIPEKAITGNSFELMFYEHQRIKRRLIQAYSGGEYKTLLDIGSGQGGLLWYWSGYERIIACEPNAKHRTEFKRRCAGLKLPVFDNYEDVTPGTKRFVVLLPYKAQDTSEILQVVEKVTNGRKVDVVSLMDVGTFLWESPEILNAAVATIQKALRKGGAFIWKMMSGDLVRQSLDDSSDGKKRLNLGELYIDYEVVGGEIENKIGIYIPDSITAKGGESAVQEEWLTSTEQFRGIFSDTGEYHIVDSSRADKQLMLSENEKTFSSWFEYGVIKKDAEPLQQNEQILSTARTPNVRGRGRVRGGAISAGGKRGGAHAPARREQSKPSAGFRRIRKPGVDEVQLNADEL